MLPPRRHRGDSPQPAAARGSPANTCRRCRWLLPRWRRALLPKAAGRSIYSILVPLEAGGRSWGAPSGARSERRPGRQPRGLLVCCFLSTARGCRRVNGGGSGRGGSGDPTPRSDAGEWCAAARRGGPAGRVRVCAGFVSRQPAGRACLRRDLPFVAGAWRGRRAGGPGMMMAVCRLLGGLFFGAGGAAMDGVRWCLADGSGVFCNFVYSCDPGAGRCSRSYKSLSRRG